MDNLRERWDALDEKTKSSILDKHRDTNTDYDWWDTMYADFIEQMKEKDIVVSTRTVRTVKGRHYEEPEINFSGFCSQGDGASFSGYIHGADVLKRMKEHKVLGPLVQHINDMGSFSWDNRRGSYSHSGCMSYSFECSIDEPDDDDPPLRKAAKQQIYDETLAAMEDFEKALWEEIVGYADKLYRDLEEEYDHLTSDEIVLETLLANESILEEELDELESA